MPGKYALIIGNTEYTDSRLAQLNAPGKDAEDFARALQSEEIAAFDEVVSFVNENVSKLNEAIEEFFSGKTSDDLLVFYFSGHGVRDESGSLFLAVKNTNRSRLHSTAITADFVRKLMDYSHSRRQVIILDCCNSGAFAYGAKAEAGGTMGIAKTFEGTGYGRVVLTATDSTQFAWEGDKIIGDETTNSLFTHFLVRGLEGEADKDGDGKITVDELYDFAYEQIVSRTPKQTPVKWSYKQQGEIVLRQSTKAEDIKPIPLPADLNSAIENSITYVRRGAVQQLEELLNGKNIGLAHSARKALEHIAQEDDSRQVAQLAAQALASVYQTEIAKREAKEEAERLAVQKAKEDRLVREKAELADLIKAAGEKSEREALAAQAAREKTERDEKEKIAREIAEKAALDKAKAERDAIAKVAIDTAEKEKRETKPETIFENPIVDRPKSYRPERAVFLPHLSSFKIWGIGFASFTALALIIWGLSSLQASPPITQTPSVTQTIFVGPATKTLVPATSTAAIVPAPILDNSSTEISPKDGMTLLYVPEGEFTMGSKSSSDEYIHKVTLDAFWIDQTEVTNKQYAQCLDDGVCQHSGTINSSKISNYYENPEFANYPVINVTWDEATAYCKWADRRLPTEAEWEKAARGTDGRTYPWGNDAPNDTLLNYNQNIGDTTEVGKYPDGKSIYGAYDMAGNVWEWVNDWYNATYYTISSLSNPLGPDSSQYRVLRGGSWGNLAFDVRSANRFGFDPFFSYYYYVGFRCARSLP